MECAEFENWSYYNGTENTVQNWTTDNSAISVFRILQLIYFCPKTTEKYEKLQMLIDSIVCNRVAINLVQIV